MLKFFRRIRQKLVNEGNLKRYLIYAIGEILLVMIGILLALQVNNWNERNKIKKTEYQALKDLQEEFNRNITDFHRVQSIRKKALLDLHKHLDKIFQVDKSLNDSIIIRPIDLGTPTWNLANPILDGLLGNGTVSTISNDRLKYLVSSWIDVSENYTEQENEYVHKIVLDLWEYEKQRVPRHMPVSDDITNPQGGYKYYDKIQLTNYYSRIITEMEYVNNVKACVQKLTILMLTGKEVEITYKEINDLINFEIEQFEK